MDKKPPALSATIDSFLEAHSMSPVTFGRTAMNDPHFVRDLRKGRRLWPETEAKVRRFMDEFEPVTARPSAEAA